MGSLKVSFAQSKVIITEDIYPYSDVRIIIVVHFLIWGLQNNSGPPNLTYTNCINNTNYNNNIPISHHGQFEDYIDVVFHT